VYDPTVAIEETGKHADGLEIFPNPADSRLFFKNEWETARIFDVNGRIVLEKQNTGETTIDVSGLHSGMYFVEISEKKNTRKTGRFVKK
jgi:hypothetical protein